MPKNPGYVFQPRRWRAGLICALILAACQSPADTTPPTVVSSIPANGASDIAVSAKLSIVFSEIMRPASVRVVPTPATDLGAAVWNDGKTVVYTPPGGWQAGTSYAFAVEGKDLAGNALSGSKSLAFQTLAPPDTTPPATPTGVKATAGDGEFSVEWNASPEPDLAAYTVFFGLSATALDNSISVDKPGLKTTIGGLENGKTYFFAVDARDTSGNHSARSVVGSVTPKDMTAPTLVSSEPANGTQDLALVPVLRFTFSEPMDPSSLEVGLCVGTDPPASATCPNPTLANFGTPTWSAGNTVVQFTPTNQIQAGKTHAFVLSAKDKTGNPLAPQTTVAFSVRATPDTTAPSVTGDSYSLNKAAPSLSINILFSEPMDQKSVEDAFLSQPALGCAWTWVGNQATCQVISGLKQHTNYTVTISTGAKDTAGNALVAPYQLLVIVGNFAPRVIRVSPRDGALNVVFNSPITLTFSEPMNPGVTQSALHVYIGNVLVPGNYTWNAENTGLTFKPNTGYGFGQTVRWEIAAPASDLEGAQVPFTTGSFTTRFVIQP